MLGIVGTRKHPLHRNIRGANAANSLIKATARLEFEDGLRTEWLEDRSPPWRLLLTLLRPHLAKN